MESSAAFSQQAGIPSLKGVMDVSEGRLKHRNRNEAKIQQMERHGERIKILGERHPIALEDIAPSFTKAIIAVEDSRFYGHSGIDHRGLVRAFLTNLRQIRKVLSWVMNMK